MAVKKRKLRKSQKKKLFYIVWAILGLKASFEKEKAKVHTTGRCRICVFHIEKIISGI